MRVFLVFAVLFSLHPANVLTTAVAHQEQQHQQQQSNLSPNNNNEFSEDENRRFMREHREVEEGNAETKTPSSDGSIQNHFSDTLPGDPQKDYPTYTNIPKTRFSCRGKVDWRYYADVDTDCQIFHVCQNQYSKISFVCPIGSIFNQRHLVCDWWYNFDCQDAAELYAPTRDDVNDAFPRLEQDFDEGNRISPGFDLSLASSGGNDDPDTSSPSSFSNQSEPMSDRNGTEQDASGSSITSVAKDGEAKRNRDRFKNV